MLKVQTSNFMLFERKGYWTKNCKTSQKGAWPRSRDSLFRHQRPQNISGIDVAINFKFGVQVRHKTSSTKQYKIWSKWAWHRSRVEYWNPYYLRRG